MNVCTHDLGKDEPLRYFFLESIEYPLCCHFKKIQDLKMKRWNIRQKGLYFLLPLLSLLHSLFTTPVGQMYFSRKSSLYSPVRERRRDGLKYLHSKSLRSV